MEYIISESRTSHFDFIFFLFLFHSLEAETMDLPNWNHEKKAASCNMAEGQDR